MEDSVEVPEDFKRIGYSGLFWKEIEVHPDAPNQPPCLLGNTGWMLLSRDEGKGIIVRRDADALADIFVRR